MGFFFFYKHLYCLRVYSNYLTPKDLDLMLAIALQQPKRDSPLAEPVALKWQWFRAFTRIRVRVCPAQSRYNLYCSLHFQKEGVQGFFLFPSAVEFLLNERLLGKSESVRMWKNNRSLYMSYHLHRYCHICDGQFVMTCQIWENAKKESEHVSPF